MTTIDEQTLKDLEFTIIQEWLTNFASGQTAKEKLANLKPGNNFDQIKNELLQLKEFHTIRTVGEQFPAMQFEELTKELILLPIQDAVLSQDGFVRIYRASDLVNAIVYFFDKREEQYPKLIENKSLLIL